MQDHRVRLNDSDLDLIISALHARAAGVSAKRRKRLLRLAERLSEMSPGNPALRLSWGGLTAEDAID